MRQLRSRNGELRSRAAHELVRFGSAQALSAVELMARGGRRSWLSRFSDSDRLIAIEALLAAGRLDPAVAAAIALVNSSRSLEVQLHGIDILGRTRSRAAIDFLRSLYMDKVEKGRDSSTVVQGIDPIYDEWDIECHSFPNAPSPLAGTLAYTVSLSYSSWSMESPRAASEIEEDRRRILEQSSAHGRIRQALAELEASTL